MKPKTIILLVILALFVLILFQNSDPTEVELLLWEIRMPLFILILSVLFVGLILGWFTHLAYSKGKEKKAEPSPAKIDDIEQGKNAASGEDVGAA